jgi:hypothetical protein
MLNAFFIISSELKNSECPKRAFKIFALKNKLCRKRNIKLHFTNGKYNPLNLFLINKNLSSVYFVEKK